MAYTKQNFKDGKILTAEHLNHIEDGLTELNDEIEALTTVSKESISYKAFEGNKLLPSGNTTNSDSARITSAEIYVVPGEIYYLTCSNNWKGAAYVIYGDDHRVIKYAEVPDNDEGAVYNEKEVRMPDGACYFRIGCNLNIQPTGHAVSKKVQSTIPTKKWSGVTWAAVGDSLTEKNARASKNYLEYIADASGISTVNMGVSGTGYKNGEDENKAFYQRISTIPTDVDVVTVFGSFNDLSISTEIGNPTDTGTNTICGCINTTIDHLFEKCPLIRLGIITPTPWINQRPDNTDTQDALYVDAIINICNLRGIPVLDLFHCSGLRPWEESFRTLAYSNDDGDGTHPDEVGHSIVAPKIKAFLETLLT